MNPGTVVATRRPWWATAARSSPTRRRPTAGRDNVILSNNVMLAGHVTVVTLPASPRRRRAPVAPHLAALVHRRHVGSVENDLIPYGLAVGNRAHLSGLNIIGLQRRGFSREQIHSLRRAYRFLFGDEGTLAERMDDVEKEFQDNQIVREIIAFLRGGGKRGICMPRMDQ